MIIGQQNELSNTQTINVFGYGPGKSMKSWWALAAAEAGYRVLFLSFEGGHKIVSQVSDEARERIAIFELQDSATDGFASLCATTLLKNGICYVNEVESKVSVSPVAGYRTIDLNKFGNETVVVFDTYTALVISAMRQFAEVNSIDVSAADKVEWEGYGWTGRVLTWMLTQIRTLPTVNTIVIGHSTQYDKFKKDPVNPKKQGPIEWSRRQPVSSSNPHGMTIARDFDNVLYFYIDGRTAYIDTRGSKDEDAGSRIIAPARYKWHDMPFGKLAAEAGVPRPPANLKWSADEDFPIVAPLTIGNKQKPKTLVTDKAPQAQTINPAANTNSTTIKPLNLAGMKSSSLLK